MVSTAERTYIWEQVKSLPSCDHEQEPRLRIIGDGRPVVYGQCVRCGKSMSALPSRHMTTAQKEALPPFDEDAFQAYCQRKDGQRDAVSREARHTRSGPWWERYQAYIASPEWAAKRVRVLQREDYLCQGCLRRQATEVHHTQEAYRHLENEPLFELVALCGVCHRALTEIDRADDEA